MKPALAAALAAAALAAAALAATPARAADTYVAAKLGYLWPSADVVLAGGNFGQVQPKVYWEAALGVNASMFGLELSAGRFSSSNSTVQLNVASVPVLLAVQLRVPIPIVTPYVAVGGGMFFNSWDFPGVSGSHTSWGFLVGGGVDLRVSSLILGVELRYMSAEAGIPNVTLRVDSTTLMAKVGLSL